MKTKIILLAALMGAAAMSANAGVNFGFSIGFPTPVIVSPPVVYARPFAPAPVAVVQTPPCPGPGYVWTAGYWSVYPTGRVWVPGAWQYRPVTVMYGHDRDDHRDWHGGYNGHDRNGHDHNGYRR